jgi:hypothetical protein
VPAPPPHETYRPSAFRQHATAALFLPGSQQQELVPYDVVDGQAVMEGDMILGPASTVPFRYAVPWGTVTDQKSAVATVNRSHIWPRAEMPYAIDRSVKAEGRAFVDWAVAHMNTSPLKLRPRTEADRDYVLFVDSGDGSGCSSYVGRIGGPQQIELADCGRGSVVHEILHAAGFFHEQSRSDRDNFITVVWDEIDPEFRSQFQTRGARAQDIGSYDFSSIMHYSSHAFSRRGRPTMVAKVPNVRMGQREGLSTGDRQALAALYGGGPVQPQPPPRPPVAPPPVAPPPVAPPPVAPPPVPTLPAQPPGVFAGSYSSNRGEVRCVQGGPNVHCSYPGGSLFCAANGVWLDCGWSGGGQGRAIFQRQPSGLLDGSYGDWFSNNNRGTWDLYPVGVPQAPPPAPASPAPASPSITWGPAPLSGEYASSRGPMTCAENSWSVGCTFVDRGVQGRLDCVKDSQGLALSCNWFTFFPASSGRALLRRATVSERRLIGTYGMFPSDAGAGTWEMLGR